MRARSILLMAMLLCGGLLGTCGDSTVEDLQEARRLHATGQTEQAILVYEKVLEDHPEAAEAHTKLAEIYFNRGQFDLAEPHVNKAIELTPDDPATNYVRGRHLLTQQLWLQAGQALEIAANSDLFNPDYQFWLGVALVQLGKIEKAILVFQKVLNMKPDYPGVHRQLGTLYYMQSAYDRAMQEHEEAIQETPDDIEVLKQLALSYHYQKFNDLALKTARRLLELDPESASAYNILGAVAYDNREIDAAQEHFEKSISLDPKLLAPHVNLGAIYNTRGEVEKALAEYNIALEIEPDNIQIQRNLGDLYFSKGEIPQALEHYRAYHAARPKDPFVAYLGAKLIAMSKDADPQEGQDMLNKLERATGLDVAMNEIRFALTTKRAEPKGDKLNKLLSTVPYLVDVLAVRIVLYERMDDLKSADETARIALLMDIDNDKKEAFRERIEYYERGEIPPSPFTEERPS